MHVDDYLAEDSLMPWDKQRDESEEAFEAFTIYRDAGVKRSVRGVAAQLKRNISTVAPWSAKHRWMERSYAYDVEQDRMKQAINADEILAMTRRHADSAKLMNIKIIQRLKELDVAELSTSDLVLWLKVSVQVEREARGAQMLARRRMVGGDRSGRKAPSSGIFAQFRRVIEESQAQGASAET